MNPISPYLQQITRLLAESKIIEAIALINHVANSSDLLSEVTLHSSRYNRLKKQIRTGTISEEEASLVYNKIVYALIDMVKEWEEEGEDNPKAKLALEKGIKESNNLTQYTINNQGAKIGQQNIGSDVKNEGTSFKL